MYTGEVLRNNLFGNRITLQGLDSRYIAVVDALIRFGDCLLINNLPNSGFLRARNAMNFAHRINPNHKEKWESNGMLKIICPDIGVIVSSSLTLEPQEMIEMQEIKAKMIKTKQPIGNHTVKFQAVKDGQEADMVQATRVLNVAYPPIVGAIDDFSLTVFDGAEIGYVGQVSEEGVDDVFEKIKTRFNALLYTT